MGKLGETKLAKGIIEEMRSILTLPVQSSENEISFGEFMKVYDPSIESHNFTYLVPDSRNFLNLQIYNTMLKHPFIVLKLEHPLIYRDGSALEFHFDPTSRKKSEGLEGLFTGRAYTAHIGRTIQCPNDFLYNELMKLDRELYEGWESEAYPRVLEDKLRLRLEEKEFFRREYFPQSILDAIDEERKSPKIYRK